MPYREDWGDVALQDLWKISIIQSAGEHHCLLPFYFHRVSRYSSPVRLPQCIPSHIVQTHFVSEQREQAGSIHYYMYQISPSGGTAAQ